MNSKYRFARKVFLVCGVAGAVFIGAVAQAGHSSRYHRSSNVPPGHLTVKRVPNFGWNLAFNLQIDGRPVASIAQGHSYHTWLSAGTHVLTVQKVPAVGYTVPISMRIDIQPGAEHQFVALWDSGLIYLHPTGVWLTPGAYWQLRGDGA